MKLSVLHLIDFTGNWYLHDSAEAALGAVVLDDEHTLTQADIDAIADVLIQHLRQALIKPLNDYATLDDRLGVSKEADAVILARWQEKHAQDVKAIDDSCEDFRVFLCKLGLPQPRQWLRD